ncbi:MAG: glycosyltransferase family 39 protein, partial [Spirochaetia bacterium]|nr:glycosyltransferase family 39 protein [Spirochaetia bacterium]
ASSRWHITFSRVAFIGMLTLLLGTIFLYYYIRMIEDGKKGDAILSGIALGLSMYTFSGANFFPIAALLHSLWLVFSGGLKFVRRRWAPLLIAAVTATAVAAPLMQYAVKNFDSFSQRMKDVSVINDIKTEKSIIPIVKSVRSHLLMFNFEGDYNGRHNLYKKPMLDNIGGVLFIAGFFAAFFTKGWSLFIVWFFTLLCAGISTLSIEAPQAYRIIGILPAVYLFMALALKKIAAMLTGFNPKKVLLSGILPALCLSAGAINIHQYFVLYPQEKATYLSFSPEANAIARFINANHEKYAIYLAVPDSMYGFYPLEQKIICDFLTRGGRSFEYMKEENRVDDQSLAGKERVVLIVRPSEEGIISAIEREFPKAVREEHPNPYGDENLFVCYHIDPAMIKHKDGRFGPMILYR